MKVQFPRYEPDDVEGQRWWFPPSLPDDGWVSTSRSLNRRDRQRLHRSMGWQTVKVLYGAAIAALFSAGLLIELQADRSTESLVFYTILACVFLWYGVSEALTMREIRWTLASSQILIVRYQRPEDVKWPAELSPPVEYMEHTRKLWQVPVID